MVMYRGKWIKRRICRIDKGGCGCMFKTTTKVGYLCDKCKKKRYIQSNKLRIINSNKARARKKLLLEEIEKKEVENGRTSNNKQDIQG